MRPLHVVEVDIGWPPEAYLIRKLEGLAARGLRVCATGEVSRSQPRPAAVDLIRVPDWTEPKTKTLFWVVRDVLRLGLRSPRRLAALVRALPGVRLLRRALPVVLASPDVVHFEWESPAITLLPAFGVFGAPVVVSSHGGIHVRPWIGDERRAAGYPILFERAAAVHCVSEAIRRECARFGLEPSRARVIRTAVDTELFSPAPRERDGILRVISVAELHWRKGYDDALQAVALLVGDGVPVAYEILGGEPGRTSGNPNDRPRISYLIHDLGLSEHVTLVGEVSQEEVRERLHASDVLLLSSLVEGLPNAVLEAMACALPVVVTDCGGLPEAVTDGVEGFVCPRRSPQRLAAALRALWHDPAAARRMGDAGRARVCAEFGLPEQIDAFVRLYEEVASAPSAGAQPAQA